MGIRCVTRYITNNRQLPVRLRQALDIDEGGNLLRQIDAVDETGARQANISEHGTFENRSHVAFDDIFVWAGLGRRLCHIPLASIRRTRLKTCRLGLP